VKWKMIANGVLIGIFLIPPIFSYSMESIYQSQWVHIINLRALIQSVWAGLFNHPERMMLPVWGAWMGLAVIFALCILLLSRKVRAYEVVK
jgi:hypothetical protein